METMDDARRLLLCSFVLVPLVLASCAGASTRPAPSGVRADAAPARGGADAALLHAVDMQRIDEIGAGVEQTKAWDGLTLFVRSLSVTDLSPGVVVNGKVRRFDDERVQNRAWVGHARAGERWILLLDSGVEAPAWEVTVVVSDDRGASWRIGAEVRKPYYFARVSGFAFDTPAHGCIDLVLEDDYGAGVKLGHYQSCSKDAGRTWSAFLLADSHAVEPRGPDRR